MWLFGIVDLPTRIRARAVSRALDRVEWDSLLDVGAGTGVYAYCASRESSRRVVALDIDAGRIEAIKGVAGRLGRGVGLSAICGDEKSLAALPREEFAVVLAIEVLQYFPDLHGTLRSLHERLRPGGMLVAHVPIRTALWPHEHTLFDDNSLRKYFNATGFESPEIRQTFGRVSLALCAVFTWCVPRPALLAIVYPLLLLATALTPAIVEIGAYRLVIARKTDGDGMPR
jgi:SAM-dependent methyltransferase